MNKLKNEYIIAGLIVISTLGVFLGLRPADSDFPVLTGPYLGQTPPGNEPVLFAPGIIPTGLYTRDFAMTPDGNEIYYCIALANFDYTLVMVSKNINGRWTEPEVAPFSREMKHMILEPAISPDGRKFYFLSNRPDTAAGETEAGDQDIWVMDRQGDRWGEPYNPGPPINTDGAEFFASVTDDGTMYFTRVVRGQRGNKLYRSRLVNGEYTEAELLPEQVNSTANQFNAYIARDESYIILSTGLREDTRGGADYYIVFRNANDEWSDPINLGDKINTEQGSEWSPYISPDGKYFFFMAPRVGEHIKDNMSGITITEMLKLYNSPGSGYPDIYWVDASFIDDLRPDGY